MGSRIEKIRVNNFRSFGGKEELDLGSKGKNVFIFGENGVGKSSLCKAINVFFDSTDQRRTKLKIKNYSNRFNPSNSEIALKFNDQDGWFTYSEIGHSDLNKRLQYLRRTKGVLEYKNLLPIYLYSESKKKNNLFRLFVEGPFSKIRNPLTGKLIGNEWHNSKKNKLPQEFHKGVFEIANRITPTVNDILSYFDDSMRIKFKHSRTWTTNELYIEVHSDDGFVIIDYGDYLNEARLVAISISIFLSVILMYGQDNSEESDYYDKILILDDIFIGMDMGNRLPFLKVLENRFDNYQTIITTYDKSWYEVAKFHLPKSNWKFIELFSKKVNGYSQTEIYDKSNLSYEDKAKIQFEQYDYPACANYQRKAFENLIKKILPQNKLYGFDNSNEYKLLKLGVLFNNLIDYLKASSIETENLIDFRIYCKILLNPLSHDNLNSPIYRRELESVFHLLEEFNSISNELLKEVKLNNPKIRLSLFDTNEKQWYTYQFLLIDNLRVIRYKTQIGYPPCRLQLIKRKIGKNEWEAVAGEIKEIRTYFKELRVKHDSEVSNFASCFKDSQGNSILDLVN
jgi:AAA15 family ATPase/GTPase